MIEAVVFDVGECLVDETREYGNWADWLGVPRHTFAAAFGGTIARGLDYRETFQIFRPGFDLTEQRAARAAAGCPETFGEEDLYPDVRTALSDLRAGGFWVGVAGNQTTRAGGILRSLDLPTDLIATSDDWNAAKPDHAFFEKLIEAVPHPPERIVYVGDRLDNDIQPAHECGLHTALIRRGPWATLQWDSPNAHDLPTLRIESLVELPGRVAALSSSSR